MNSKARTKSKPSKMLYVLVFFLSIYASMSLLSGYARDAKNNEQAFYRHALIKACVEDAGEYVFRKVKDVEGVAQLRLRKYEGEISSFIKRDFIPYDLYGYNPFSISHLPYGFIDGPAFRYKYFETPAQQLEDLPDWTELYKYLKEVDQSNSAKVYRYHGYSTYDRKEIDLNIEGFPDYLSRYGYTFRETNPNENGYRNLVGSELIVIDMSSNEVLGVRKAYRTIRFGKNIYQCPVRGRSEKDSDFVRKILLPMDIKGDD